MAARLAPDNVRRMHQPLHHLVADAPWNDDEVLAEVRRQVLPSMQKHGPVVAWIVDDTGFPKQGKHSVGVARQYCGQIGKHDNCEAAVSLSVSTWNFSLPIAWRLYLPEVWCQDAERRQQAGVPEEIKFETKPEIALGQIRQAVEQKVPAGVVLGDAGYGNGTPFREAITKLGLQHMVGVESSTTVWEPGQQPLPAPPRKPGCAAAPKRLQAQCEPSAPFGETVGLLLTSFGMEGDRLAPGSRETLRSRFAAVRVRPAHRDYKRTEPHPEEWLLIEWPKKESEPTKYWLSTLPAKTSLKSLVKIAKHRWIIERDYEELKQELGLGHSEGRGGRGFHHHAVLCIAAYGFLISERNRFSPPHAPAILDYQPRRHHRASGPAARRVRPERHSRNSIATLRMAIARLLLTQLPHCPFCGSRSA